MKTRIIMLAIVFALSVSAGRFKGRVLRVSDGETITILDSEQFQRRIRLAKISASEKPLAAKKFLSSMVAGKEVKVEWTKQDKRERYLGEVFIGTTNVNIQLVQHGFARHQGKGDNTASYIQAEKIAKDKKLGMWKSKGHAEPKDGKKAKKPPKKP